MALNLSSCRNSQLHAFKHSSNNTRQALELQISSCSSIPLQRPKPKRPRLPQPPPTTTTSTAVDPRLASSSGLSSQPHQHNPIHPKVTLAVVGDVHEQWDDASEAALLSLGADVAVFVGDFGNEAVDLISQVANINQRKAVMLGNHDAWYSLTPRGRQRAVRMALMSSTLRSLTATQSTTAVAEQLKILGNTHVGLSSQQFPDLGISIMGARPFSKGGNRWDDIAAFYKQHYGIHSMEESSHRMLDVALSQPLNSTLILVSHNGPTGLGDRRWDPCGVDWQEPEEDHGDPDLEEALEMIAAQNRRCAVVLFGHMHHMLKTGGRRNMAAVDGKTGTVYLNAAVVPRIRKAVDKEGKACRAHHFMLVDVENGVATAAKHIWVGVSRSDGDGAVNDDDNDAETDTVGNGNGSIHKGETTTSEIHQNTAAELSKKYVCEILVEEAVLKTVAAGDGSNRLVQSYYKAHTNEWVPVVVDGFGGVGAVWSSSNQQQQQVVS